MHCDGVYDLVRVYQLDTKEDGCLLITIIGSMIERLALPQKRD